LKSNTSNSNISNEIQSDESDSESEASNSFSFGKCCPEKLEFTNLYPQYPKTHQNGYGTVIGLHNKVLTKKIREELKGSIQYSMSRNGGGGWRVVDHVPFFAKNESDKVPMMYSVRECAGAKACEFFPKAMKNHTEVDEDVALDWAVLLTKQEKLASNNSRTSVAALFEHYESVLCDRHVIGGIRVCGGRTMIRSWKDDPDMPLRPTNRLFVGCEFWQPGGKHHTYRKLDGYNPVEVLRVWGRKRCQVHAELLTELEFSWDNADADLENGIIFV
jgi:hypothetical protein